MTSYSELVGAVIDENRRVLEAVSQQEIERLVDEGNARMGDCAVLYRTNAQSRAIEEAFVRYGLPYKLVAGTRFYERKEIKDKC